MQIKKHFTIIILIATLLIASALRLYQLGNIPPSPDWDEAALGYNAYSIMQTGKDEYGKPFPIILQSFADYKPALYVYLAIPSIFAFGLDTFAVRLPSAVFGIITVFAVYFLIKELFGEQARKLALITSFLLAISPWHIQFSRVAFEANVGVALNVIGILFFLKGLKKPFFLSLSAISLGLGLYIYQSQKVFIPLLGLCLILVYWKNIFTISKKYLFSAIIVGFIVALPMLTLIITDKQTLSRAKGVSIFSAETLYTRLETAKYIADKKAKNHAEVIFHNRFIKYGREIITGYLAHFNLKWLFLKGDLERHHVPNMSLLYLWELPFLLIGIYMLLFGKFASRRTKLFIFSWFLVTPIPAAVTYDIPHAVRTINFLPTFQIFIALGLLTSFKYISNIKYQIARIHIKYLIFSFYFLFFVFNFLYYLNQYFVQQNYYYSLYWQYGYKEAVEYVKKNEDKYKKIVVANQRPLDQSYIFFLFYLKYPPQEYQAQQDPIDNLSGNYEDIHSFGKYEFRPFNWEEEKGDPTILFVGRPGDFPSGVRPIKKIDYLNGEPAISIIKS